MEILQKITKENMRRATVYAYGFSISYWIIYDIIWGIHTFVPALNIQILAMFFFAMTTVIGVGNTFVYLFGLKDKKESTSVP